MYYDLTPDKLEYYTRKLKEQIPDNIKKEVLPDPVKDYEGKIFLYTGETGVYTKGHFYICQKVADATRQYSAVAWSYLNGSSYGSNPKYTPTFEPPINSCPFSNPACTNYDGGSYGQVFITEVHPNYIRIRYRSWTGNTGGNYAYDESKSVFVDIKEKYEWLDLYLDDVNIDDRKTFSSSKIIEMMDERKVNYIVDGKKLIITGGVDRYNEYSYKEQAIGRWVDGRTLYRKTYYIEHVYQGTYYYDLGIENLDMAVNIYGNFYNRDNQMHYSLPFSATSPNYILPMIDKVNNKLGIDSQNNYPNFFAYVTLEYVKSK